MESEQSKAVPKYVSHRTRPIKTRFGVSSKKVVVLCIRLTRRTGEQARQSNYATVGTWTKTLEHRCYSRDFIFLGLRKCCVWLCTMDISSWRHFLEINIELRRCKWRPKNNQYCMGIEMFVILILLKINRWTFFYFISQWNPINCNRYTNIIPVPYHASQERFFTSTAKMLENANPLTTVLNFAFLQQLRLFRCPTIEAMKSSLRKFHNFRWTD